MLSISTDQYLTHYWPITNGTMLDTIGTSNMIQGNLTYFTSDRFGCQNSALALNGGWTYVPSGVYFNTPEFTISVWVYPQEVGSWSRVIDFGNGPAAENIELTLSSSTYLEPTLIIFSGSTPIFRAQSFQALVLNKWQFLVAIFDGTNARIYLNGTLIAESNQRFSLPTQTRTKCFIGKSNWAPPYWNDSYSSSYLDDLRFYNKSLSQTEVLDLMNQNQTSNLRDKKCLSFLNIFPFPLFKQ